jgi:hypothetical protein
MGIGKSTLFMNKKILSICGKCLVSTWMLACLAAGSVHAQSANQPAALSVIMDGLHPVRVAVSPYNGNVVVINADGSAVLVPRSLVTGDMGEPRPLIGDSNFDGFTGLAIDANGRMIIANGASNAVYVFSPDGLLLQSISSPLLRYSRYPRRVAVSPVTGDVFVTNGLANHSIVRIPASRLTSAEGELSEIADDSIGLVAGLIVSPVNGDVFVLNNGNRIVRIPASRAAGGSGMITSLADTYFDNDPVATMSRTGDLLVTSRGSSTVARIPFSRTLGDDSVPMDLIDVPVAFDGFRRAWPVSLSTSQAGDVYVIDGLLSVIPASRAQGGSGMPQAIKAPDSLLANPSGMALSSVDGDVFIINWDVGNLIRIEQGIKVVSDAPGELYTVPAGVPVVMLHTQGGSLKGGTGLDLSTTIPVQAGEKFYLVNQYNAAYVFHQQMNGQWEPFLVSGGAGNGSSLGSSVQTAGVPRSDGNGTIYPGNAGIGYVQAGGGGWGGGAAHGIGPYPATALAQAGSGSKGGNSRCNKVHPPAQVQAEGGVEGAPGENCGYTGGSYGGQGAVSLTEAAGCAAFALAGGNSYATGYTRGGAGYSAGGNTAQGVNKPSVGAGAGSGYAAQVLAGQVIATSSPAGNGNVPMAQLIPLPMSLGIPPSPAAVCPSAGPSGTQVSIKGAHLSSITEVDFGGVPATDLKAMSDAEITVTVPEHALGPVDVTVVNAAGHAEMGKSFTYTTSRDP